MMNNPPSSNSHYPGALPVDSTATQLRFVPTLTEVVANPTQTSSSSSSQNAFEKDVLSAGGLAQELLVQRVLQRIDLGLDRRLREAVGQLVMEHTQSLAPRLRKEIEAAVRESVSQAFAQEKIAQSANNLLKK